MSPCRFRATKSNLGEIEHRFHARHFSSRGSLRERHGTRRESRFAFYIYPNVPRTIARHMGLSSTRKFDVLTVAWVRRIYIYIGWFSRARTHMVRDKNARACRSHACERKMLGRNVMAHLSGVGWNKG